ncbi:CotH kinase family protein [Acinetobacter soli]|uniref:CotH kinase family protein n=1 Tax=Acinetobacter soli TaxID=487316 RepID=UPI001ABBFD61|nr:CotH kinase family protein [Acinetobacter soli]MBO3672786.1 CotH kinase family protein [Acinetobacter soli]
MTNLTPKSQFDDVYQLERNDPALAGPGGVLNKPLQNLTNRTEFLNDTKANKTDIVKGQYSFTTLAKFNEKKATIPANSTVIIEEAGANQGTNTWDGTTLTKSVYDPLAQAKADATAKAEAAKNDAITTAATDASTKAATAETNAKLYSENNAVALSMALESLVIVLNSIIVETDSNLDALNTSIRAVQANLDAINDSNQHISSSLSLSIQVLTQAIAEITNTLNSDVQNLIDGNTNAISATSLGLQTVVTLISDITNIVNANYSEYEKTSVKTLDNENSVTALSVAIQTLVFAFNEYVSSTDDYFSEEKKLERLFLVEQLIAEFASSNSGSGSSALIKVENAIVFEKPNNIIRIDFSGDLIPAGKGTVKKSEVTLTIDGAVYKTFGTYEVQGNGSVQYPKKNLTFGFFTDDSYVNSQTIKIGAVIPHDEWVFKANYIDSTHVRQMSSYMLWSQVMQSRDLWPQRDIDNSYVGKTGLDAIDTGALGHPIGYPCVVYFNGDYYGIGTFQIGKKRANYNIPKNSPKMIQVEPDGQNIDITDWTNAAIEIKAPSKPNADTAAAFLAWDTFAQSAQADFTANIATYTNKQNIIDYYLLVQFLAATDCVGANFNFVTWDGTRWYFMPYDLDSVYGLEVTGTIILNTVNQSMTEFSRPRQQSKDFWKKVEIAYATDINKRYAQLRNQQIFSVKNILKNIRELNDKYTADLFKAEYAKWPALPSLNITNTEQIATWVKARLVYLDSKFSYTA